MTSYRSVEVNLFCKHATLSDPKVLLLVLTAHASPSMFGTMKGEWEGRQTDKPDSIWPEIDPFFPVHEYHDSLLPMLLATPILKMIVMGEELNLIIICIKLWSSKGMCVKSA